jgi:hypothetical protein
LQFLIKKRERKKFSAVFFSFPTLDRDWIRIQVHFFVNNFIRKRKTKNWIRRQGPSLAESVHDAALRRGIEEGHGAVHEAEQGLAVECLGARQGGQVEQQARHHGCQGLQQAQAPVHGQVQVPDTQRIDALDR